MIEHLLTYCNFHNRTKWFPVGTINTADDDDDDDDDSNTLGLFLYLDVR